MESTLVVRRIDDLGRVVIPKEIRKTLRIRSGDALEIFSDNKSLVLKKYSPAAAMEEFSSLIAKNLSDAIGKTVFITDNDRIICGFGGGRDHIGNEISKALSEKIDGKKCVLLNRADGSDMIPLSRGVEPNYTSQIVSPVFDENFVYGAVVVVGQEPANREDVRLTTLSSNILASQIK